jgi:hypothetical protein
MSASTSETRLAHTILLRGGVVLRTIGDAMRYLDVCRECTERRAIRLMLQQAHWYGADIETTTGQLSSFLEREGLVLRRIG